ncbi:hypothetical protein V8F20_011123 [Naviculisporaceae sp. PSN 640]
MAGAGKGKHGIRNFFRRWIPRTRKEAKEVPSVAINLAPRHGTGKGPKSHVPSKNGEPIDLQIDPQIDPRTDKQIPAEATTIQIDISDIPIWCRKQLSLPLDENVFHVDPRDWAIAQQNFIAPLGHHFDPDDPEKPEEYAPIWDAATRRYGGGLIVPQFRHGYEQHRLPGQGLAEEEDETAPPPSYEWAAISTLPRPVRVSDDWASIFAAQREMSHLLAVQSYIDTRIPEIKRQSASVLRAKTKDIPMFQFLYLASGATGMLRTIQPDRRERARDGPFRDLTKVNLLRERLSPVSFLSFARGQGADGDHDDSWGWDWDLSRVRAERSRILREGPRSDLGYQDCLAL